MVGNRRRIGSTNQPGRAEGGRHQRAERENPNPPASPPRLTPGTRTPEAGGSRGGPPRGGPSAPAPPPAPGVGMTKSSSDSSSPPPAATTTTSHQPACTGLPPRRTSRRSTGRSTGSVAPRNARPTGPKGDRRRVRTSQDASATSALRTNREKTP